MKPRRFFFRCTPLFEAPLRYGVPVFAGLVALVTGLDAHAGDILRGGAGATAAPTRSGAGGGGAPTPAATAAARANARDTLARTTRTLTAMRAMQQAARQAAVRGPNHLGKTPGNPTVPLPTVPNGLGIGGLRVSTAANLDPSKWQGAVRPKQSTVNGRTKVTIKQTESQANLHWDTFNVGKNTTLTFDQSKGGENAGQWIAFNHVNDPTGNPSQILGSIQARGQVYLINRNGIIFGGSSQVNARGLTVSSLPINTNLINQGLLNNRDAQFLFSGIKVPGGSDGTPDFTPEGPPASGTYGDVTVQRGAVLRSPGGDSGNGGRIMLVGSNVINAGTISTESGQTILAAGSQVGIAAHDGGDPSLRGLDVWVGLVSNHAGTATNSGVIETLTGSTLITGKSVRQLGVIESSTSVNLNGRIDLIASYSAVANPNFDNSGEIGFGAPRFLYEKNGIVTLGSKSTSRILPDYASADEVAGTSLPEASQIHIDGLAIHLAAGSDVFAPNADITVRAGTRTYTDADGNRTIFDATGKPEAGLTNHYTGSNQKFLFSGGRIHIDRAANISVAGSVDVFVPTEQNLLDIELRGAELADSPLQRESGIRGASMTVDIRKTGSYAGRFWQGTPLGDVTGLAGLIRRNAAQLTANGGNISMKAGDSIVMSSGSNVDVSGGFFLNEGGKLKTSSLVSNGRLIAIEDATPDRQYDSVFNGETSFLNPKWGIIETYATPLFSSAVQSDYVSGAAGGTLTLSAPAMALDGNLRGTTIRGNQQRSAPPAGSTLDISFLGERAVQIPGSVTVNYINFSPTPPEVRFAAKPPVRNSPTFQLVNGEPVALPQSRLDTVTLAQSLLDDDGFGSLAVTNPDGDIIVPRGTQLSTDTGGAITLKAANITVGGSLVSPSGSISLTTYNISPSFTAEYGIINPPGSVPFPAAATDRGLLHLTGSARIHTAGLISNDLPGSSGPLNEPVSVSGGAITLRSYHTRLDKGSVLDVSGGVHVSDLGTRSYGNGGSITVVSGTDDGFPGIIGGNITLDASLRGYSGAKGGTLAIQANTIQIGNRFSGRDLNLSPEFFRRGGFTSYALSAIGRRSSAAVPTGQFESYAAAILIDGSAHLNPLAENWIAVEDPAVGRRIILKRQTREEGLRSPVSLDFRAIGSDDPNTIDSLEVRGDLVMNPGASIKVSPGGSVTLRGQTATVLGSVSVPGGSILVSGSDAFPLTTSQRLQVTQAMPTVHIGKGADLSVAGRFLSTPDVYGRRSGTVFSGGSIQISGNIIAARGAVLDASGSSAILDIPASGLGGESSVIPSLSGLFSPPLVTRGFATRIDSAGGRIDLSGSQMLLSDATLLGSAGGDTASAGSLAVSSGRYYEENSARTGADINLLVRQNGNVLRGARVGVGVVLRDSNGAAYGNLGEFSLSRFHQGGFANLSLGGNYDASGSVPLGGNVSFLGDVFLRVPGSLRLAAGGILTGDGRIAIRASYAAIGQGFRPPENPGDTFLPFRQDPAIPSPAFLFPPRFGPGGLTLNADFIDVGTLSLQNIGEASLNATHGDIRGNSTLHIAGDLTLKAATIYPTTGSEFSLFAYDHANGSGSITFNSSGKGGTPVSAGGTLAAYATHIVQNGNLRAPGGSIILGWDGTDLDSTTPETDGPFDPIAGTILSAPITSQVRLGPEGVTSVSFLTDDNLELLVPYGNSPDGRSWIDPAGLNVSLNGIPGKGITVSGDRVSMASRSRVDVRGGGDLIASRWIAGNGGSVNLLGAASRAWSTGQTYSAGDLVTYQGETWSARVGHSGQTPSISRYWTKVAESYAILPSSSLPYSPYNPFNIGSNASLLSGDPGYVDSSLHAGDAITLEASPGLAAGTYTLLPRRYALMPGAFLVTPLSTSGLDVVVAADGSSHVPGYVQNRFDAPGSTPADRSRFEITPASVFGQRAEYQIFQANGFLGGLAGDAGSVAQHLPGDAGGASFHGSSDLHLAGKLLTSSPGRGAAVDISSFSAIRIAGSNPSSQTPGSISISSSLLSSWKVDSLLIGGLRQDLPDGTVSVDVRTNDLTVANAGASLEAADLVLVSNAELTVLKSSSLAAVKSGSFNSDPLTFSGGGSIVRVSADRNSSIIRKDLAATDPAALQVDPNARMLGASVVLDSTSAMALSSSVRFNTGRLTIGSGGIGIILSDSATGPATNGNQLVLAGATLDNVFRSEEVTLRSYGAIDLYGSGTLGGSEVGRLTLSSSSLRGFERESGNITIRARQVTLDNALASAAITPVAESMGTLHLAASRILLGDNPLVASGFSKVALSASDRLIVNGTGSLEVIGEVTASTPLITGTAGSIHSISSTGAMTLNRPTSGPGAVAALGANLALQGSSITSDANILLPSGEIRLTATEGDVVVGGTLSAAGTSKRFGDTTRYTDAGTIRLTSQHGDVILGKEAMVSVSANRKGGNAGTIGIGAANGVFRSLAEISGNAAADFAAGSFSFDAGSILARGAGSLADLNSRLDAGGFVTSRDFRIRTGDVLMDHQIRSHQFRLSADQGAIRVSGGIDASGATGGSITLAAHGDLTLSQNASLSVAAEHFNSAGKGGSIHLEAGTQRDGVANTEATLTLASGATLDLSVDDFKAGSYLTAGSSAFEGKFTGTLHLRAPRNDAGTDLGIASIHSNIIGASAVIAEGYKIYRPTGGTMNTALRNLIHSDNTSFLGAAGSTGGNDSAIRGRLLAGSADPGALAASLVVAPGVEIINPTGDLTLGSPNLNGSTNVEARHTADWDLSSFRYGSDAAPGILTLRASGDLVFNNTLSDGFSAVETTPFLSLSDAGDSLMWLGTLDTIRDGLPTNFQSWSYRLTAGADTDSSDFGAVLDAGVLGTKGSILVGELHAPVPNSRTSGLAAAIGSNGLTANSIRISTSSSDRGTRFEVIRTGTGDISLHAGQDIQLRNQFASIYTAGVAIPEPTRVFGSDDFVLPVVPGFDLLHPSQSGGLDLGAVQQLYQPNWSMAGGDVTLHAARDIGRYTLVSGVLTVDSSRQMPTNWLYRRGFVDPATGRFSNDGGFGDNREFPALPDSIYDPATSTAWWVDYSNFFQSIGTLGGGNINLKAGNDIINADAAAPTNARMAGRVKNPAFGSKPGAPEYINLAPDMAKLVEYGGGDITISSGRNIDGGTYYVERGTGVLRAGGDITTNSARTPSRGILAKEAPYDSRSWLPTTLFTGKSQFDVAARGSVLLGPVSNPFLLPQGLNNRYWYKTYFNTFSTDSGATVAAYGGDVTHRNAVALPSGGISRPILNAWFTNQNLFTGAGSTLKSSYYQPWLRLMETGLSTFSEVFKLNAPNLRSISFGGDIHLVGDMTLAPSPTGNIELLAADGIIGLNPTGISSSNGQTATIWTSAKVNLSDASPASIPGILTPLAYQSVIGRDQREAVFSGVDVLQSVSLALNETGSYSGIAATNVVQSALHGDALLHAGDPDPVLLTAAGGDITGLTLFSPKTTRITAQQDISDVSFYLQNTGKNDISLVSAGRNLTSFAESSALRSIANNLDAGNIIGDPQRSTSLRTSTNARAGDIQINGPGVLEVLAGNTLDLGTGANFIDGTGTGITSIGNNRNPNLPFTGADLIVLAGVKSPDAKEAARGLSFSSLDFDSFIRRYVKNPGNLDSNYLDKIGRTGEFDLVSSEQQNIAALDRFFSLLRESGRDAGTTGDYSAGFAATRILFGDAAESGNIEVRAREIRTVTGGAITLAVPSGDIRMASEVFGNPLTPPGIVTEYGGAISSFTDGDVEIGQARIFTLRGGDIIMWSSKGNIAAGSAPRTVVTAPPTRVVVNVSSATVETDLGGLATGGGIGVLAAVEGVEPGDIDLIAPNGFVDAGDAGIRVTGNLNIAAQTVLNSSNISVGGTTTGAAVSAPAAPSVSTVTNASNSSAASTASVARNEEREAVQSIEPAEESLSVYTVEVIGYGGGSGDDEEEEDENTPDSQ